jgi:3-keto-L-gulonate-6-phosphate decarboxylase
MMRLGVGRALLQSARTNHTLGVKWLEVGSHLGLLVGSRSPSNVRENHKHFIIYADVGIFTRLKSKATSKG